MKRLVSLLTFIFVSLSFIGFYSQSNEIQVSDIKTKTYPEYSGQMLVRNPDKIDLSKISFFEGDKELNVSFSDPRPGNAISSNKTVLFVVLNHQAYRNRTRWYQNVIRASMNKGMMSPGDEFALVSFDCNRPEYGKEKKQLLFPENPNFTQNSEEFTDQLNDIDLRKSSLNLCTRNSEIHLAILKSLELLDEVKTNNSKSIVVLADDWSRERMNDDIKDLSRKVDIPIYGITYWQNIQRHYGIEDICDHSYGIYALDKNNSASLMSDNLVEFMNNQIQRASGWVYDISFKSPHNKDGQKHTIRVQYKSDKQVTAFEYSDPKQTFSDWIENNTGLFIGFILLLILIVILTIVFVRKAKKQKLEAERLQEAEMEKVRKEQQQAASKASQQEEELKRIRSEENARIEAEKAKKRKKEKEEQDAQKLQQMSSRGNLPWFTYDFNGSSGSIEMNAPDFSFGRGKDVHYTLNHKTVSREHFVVSFNNGSYTIQDLGSSNGTFVNGNKISQAKLKHGDVIGAGEILLTFHI